MVNGGGRVVESTLSETVLWSGLRALLVASLALWPLLMLRRVWEGLSSDRGRMLVAGAAVFPFFVPELLTGFHYRVQASIWAAGLAPDWSAVFTEGLYGLIQLLRAVSVGALVLFLLARDPVAGSSRHLWRLSGPVMSRWRQVWGLFRLHLEADWAGAAGAWSVMALVVFQEFETAALMQIDRHPLTWTVWLFDAHAARQPLEDSLRMAVWPLVFECLLLSPAVAVLLLRRGTVEGERAAVAGGYRPAGRIWVVLACVWGLLAAGVLLGVPLWRMGADAASGLALLLGSGGMLRQSLAQVFTSALISSGAAIAALGVCGLILEQRERSTGGGRLLSSLFLGVLLLPGLAGSLAASLGLLELFQVPVLQPLYETWLPLLLGLTLSMLPRAFGLQLLLRLMRTNEGLFLADALRWSGDGAVRRAGAAIVWRLSDVRWVIAGLILTQWCFWDVTTTSLLRPLSPEPVVTRLYNEMHFARTEALLGLTVLSAIAPAFLWVSSLLLLRIWRMKKDTKQSFVS